MKKTILLTGATDGIGLETAKKLASMGHTLLLHGRSESKLTDLQVMLAQSSSEASIETYCADLSDLSEVVAMASAIKTRHSHVDVLINNAGVFKTASPITGSGHDIRFVVNTLAPYVLTKALMSLFDGNGRVVNLSSAAQAPVSLDALRGQQSLSDSGAYAQSKLAITMWTFQLAQILPDNGPALIAVNPASFLGSKMVKEAYGSQGKDLSIGVDILVRAALSEDFSGATGKYFDNDLGNWADPHPDALNQDKNQTLVATMHEVLNKLGINIT